MFKVVRFSLTLSLLFVLLSGCATTKALTLKDEPQCESSVEGFLHSEDEWSGPRPALILKKDRKKVLAGDLIAVDDEGVRFDASKQGPFFDPEEKYYPYSEVELLVGETGEVLHGKISMQDTRAWGMDIVLIPAHDLEAKTIKLSLPPNESFSYCLPPGEYLIKDIFFVDKNKNIDRGIDYPEFMLRVEAGASNYIGDFYLDNAPSDSQDSFEIPYKIHSRPNEAAMAGVLGGAIGGALHAVSIGAKGIVGKHKLVIEAASDFEPLGKNPKKINLLYRD